ncbi:MAG: VWA domain-containing protein [Planctomycetaceae bacterium]|nr:VWA domain-containing protein [Planctomycetaceae bacterium]
MKFLSWVVICVVALPLLAGCEDPLQQAISEQVAKSATKQASKPVATKSKKPPPEAVEIISRAYGSTRSASGVGLGSGTGNYTSHSPGASEEAAIKKVGAAIRASLDLGPTLVVWLVDRTPSAQRLVGSAVPAAKALYDDPDLKQLASSAPEQLLTAVIAFDDKADFVLDPPSADLAQAQASLDRFPPSTSGRESTFAAVKQALGKYLLYRTDAARRREVLFVILTDEAGDDASLVDELADTVKRNALPVYCVGSPAPWGQVNPMAADPKKIDPAKTDDSEPNYGPETIQSERVDIEMPAILNNDSGRGGEGYVNLEFVDSGFGPYALERLCRASGGQFLAIRPDSHTDYGFQGGSFWPNGSELRFESESPAKYAPDYVSAEEHRKLLAENKAHQALAAAAMMPRLRITDQPDRQFAKANEAQMKRTLDKAQQYAAKNAPVIDNLYNVLANGEGDRTKLTSPRLQAQFDLAMGRVAAAKARIDGYNSMIAALKRDHTFANESSSAWVIESADVYETESSIKKLAERAKMYLQRVIAEHPGTPWAKIAEAELSSPMGWTWKEI